MSQHCCCIYSSISVDILVFPILLLFPDFMRNLLFLSLSESRIRFLFKTNGIQPFKYKYEYKNQFGERERERERENNKEVFFLPQISSCY